MKLLDTVFNLVVESVKYTNDQIAKEAQKYKTRNEFKKGSEWAYNASRRNGIMDDVTKHMEPVPQGTYMSDDEILQKGLELAKNYNRSVDFKNDNKVLYSKLGRRGLLSQVVKNFPDRKKDKWTYDELKNLMSKYDTKREFRNTHSGAYTAAYESPYWKELTSHMKALGNIKKRLVYSYEFPELKSVYVGLTGDEDRRKQQHKTEDKSSLYRYMQKHPGIEPIYKVKSLGYIDAQEASKMETNVENYYRNSGWQLLNVAKTGGLGGRLPLYSDDFVIETAKNYTILADFWKEHKKMLSTVIKYNKPLYDEVTSNMRKNVLNNQKYKLEDVIKITNEYDSLSDFKEDHPKMYSALQSRGLLQQVTNHMSRKVVRNYTEDQLRAIASKYKTFTEFKSGNSGAYGAAQKRGILRDITKHMPLPKNEPKGNEYWINKALSYGTLKGISMRDPNLYAALVRNKLLGKVKDLLSQRNG